MLKLETYQQVILKVIATAILFLLGLAVLGLSLFSANRQQATGIKQVITQPVSSRGVTP